MFIAQQCSDYVRGFVDGSENNPYICMGGKARYSTIVRLYVAHMHDYAKELDELEYAGMLHTLMLNYPCAQPVSSPKNP